MKKRGFTVIELLIVVLLIGVFASMTVFSYRKTFMRSKLETTMNEVRALYEGVNKKVVTEGYKYVLQIDREEESISYISTETLKKEVIVLREGLDLDFVGADNPIQLTVYVDGFVKDDDNVRVFKVTDEDIGQSISFYISPLGVMEASLK